MKTPILEFIQTVAQKKFTAFTNDIGLYVIL